MTDDSSYFQISSDYFEIEVAVNSPQWADIDNITDAILRPIKASVNILEFDKLLEFSISLTDDDNIRELNKNFRGKDKATNVLSFPDGTEDEEQIYLGDIAIAYETLVLESETEQKPFNDHLTHLVLHGFLHLCGYDHEDDTDAEEMESLEIEILQDIGIKNPYTDFEMRMQPN